MKRLLVRNGNDAKANVAELNFQNRTLYHGDNLDFLRGMNSETIHLIATDPPFNKNRDFHATPDSLAKGARFRDRWSWDRDVHEEWVDSIKDDWPAVWSVIEMARTAYGNDMGAFLCWLGVRLMEMRRVLREDGSIYLHCDSTANSYIRTLMDGIFGHKNFRDEVIWKRHSSLQRGSQHRARKWGTVTDSIMYYAKSSKVRLSPFRELTEDEALKKFTKIDEQGRRYYDDSSHIWSTPNMGARPNLCYEWRGYKNPHPSGWRLSKERLEEEYQKGNIVIREDGRLERRKYESDYRGVPVGSLWIDDDLLLSGNSNERTGYPTQKPLALYERIIKASSSEGDFVLDPFCGCATTPIAAERLKRQWIGMDIWDGALEQVQNRLARDTILRFDDQQHHVTLPKVHYETKAPVRTDDNEIAAPTLKLRIQRPAQAWEKISHKGMVNVLAQAQRTIDGIICGGCGRVLEREFMELDHITPKKDRGANHILNRILLCRPCNRRKRENLTLSGLLRENKKVKWMRDEKLAKRAQNRATDKAEWARDHFHTEECQALIAGNYPDSAV